MTVIRHSFFVALTAVALMGAGCVTTGGKTPAPAAKAPAATVAPAQTTGPDLTALAAACGESGGTFIAASAGCMCQPGFMFETKTNECLSADGTPGGVRGAAMRANLTRVIDCTESGGTYDVAKGWCRCPAGLSFGGGECVAADGIPGGERGKSARRDLDQAAAPAATASSPAPASQSTSVAVTAQQKCEADARQYLVTFQQALQKPIANRYTDFTQSAHYNLKESTCYTLINYRPRVVDVTGGQMLVETDYESVGDVGAVSEVANCVRYLNTRTGGKSEECFIGVNRFTTMIYNDFLRQSMEIRR